MRLTSLYLVMDNIEKSRDEKGNFTRSAQQMVEIMHLAYIKQISLSEFMERVRELKAAGEETFGAENLE